MSKMRKLSLVAIILSVVFLSSCADSKTINGKTYRPYGLLNEDEFKNDSIEYTISFGACVSGILFIELIIPTVYTYGFNLYEPIGVKNNYKEKGVISE